MLDIYKQNRQPALYASTVVLLLLATTAVFLRLLSRRKSAAPFWWDDYAIAIALFFYYLLTICHWLQACLGGLGLHTVSAGGPVDAATLVKFQKVFLAIQICYFCTSVSFKTSLILLYYRIFGVIRWFRALLIIAEGIVAFYFLVCFFTAIFECRPVAYYWDKSISHGSCIDETDFYRWNGVANLVIDFMILILSFPIIWKLNIRTRQKATLSGVFLLGLLVCIISITRVTTFDHLTPTDEPYTGIPPAICTVAEQCLGIVCACLPCLRPLFDHCPIGSGTSVAHGENTDGTELVKRRHESTAGFARLAEQQRTVDEDELEGRALGSGGVGREGGVF